MEEKLILINGTDFTSDTGYAESRGREIIILWLCVINWFSTGDGERRFCF